MRKCERKKVYASSMDLEKVGDMEALWQLLRMGGKWNLDYVC